MCHLAELTFLPDVVGPMLVEVGSCFLAKLSLSQHPIKITLDGHGLMALVLSFLLAHQTQSAADRYRDADSNFREMVGLLVEFALVVYGDLKVDACALENLELLRSSSTSSNVNIVDALPYGVFYKLLQSLLLESSRDLQKGSAQGTGLDEETYEQMKQKHFDPEMAALEAVTEEKALVFMLIHCLVEEVGKAEKRGAFVKCATTPDVARNLLHEYLKKWQSARNIAYSDDHIYLHVLMVLLVLVFCVTLPFPLATMFPDDWFFFLPSLVVSFSFFAVHAAARRIGTPFGFDTTDVPVIMHLEKFRNTLQSICSGVGDRQQCGEEEI